MIAHLAIPNDLRRILNPISKRSGEHERDHDLIFRTVDLSFERYLESPLRADL